MRRNDMDVHKIQIAPWLAQKLKLEMLTYPNKQNAVNALTEALVKNDFKFSIEDEGNKKRFFNESGGELAAVVPAS